MLFNEGNIEGGIMMPIKFFKLEFRVLFVFPKDHPQNPVFLACNREVKLKKWGLDSFN